MRFSELCDKEVVNANDCKCIGRVRDIDFDCECGRIEALIVPGPGKCMGIFGKDFEFCIPWVNIIRIGPDIILVNLDEQTMKKKIKF